jgi:catechol 2,3-dioxygenase-like lactoylglutathione lyase family enzyme
MLDHIGIAVTHIEKSKSFYIPALAPLGIAIVMEFPEAVGLGAEQKPFFWLGKADGAAPVHVAFAAKTRAAVDAFHKAALAAGGRDNGGPGLRPHYHAHYYGAFVLDPDGHNIEAVCHTPE